MKTWGASNEFHNVCFRAEIRKIFIRYPLLSRGMDIWTVSYENLFLGMCGQQRPRSDCASMQSDQGLHCLLTESLHTTESINGEQMPGWHFGHAQEDLNLHMFDSTILLDVAHIQYNLNGWLVYGGWFELFFQSLPNSSNSSRKQIFRDVFLFYHGIVCCVYSLELPHRCNSNEYTQHTIIVRK